MPPFVNGLLFGLIFIFAIGPSFFLLIQNSIEYGFRRGAFIAIGISLSDIFFVSLTLIGMSSLISDPQNTQWLSMIGAAILAVFGIYYFFRTPKIYNNKKITNEHGVFRFLLKGFLINIFNPTIILFWITLSSSIATNYKYSWADQRNFFIGILITVLACDLLKSLLANHVRNFITIRSVRIFNQLVGGALVVFALSLLFGGSAL